MRTSRFGSVVLALVMALSLVPCTLAGHSDDMFNVAFSPHRQILASVAGDKTSRLWLVADFSLLRVLDGHRDAVQGVTFSPDGTTLATASWDSTVRLWGVR